MSSQMNIRDVAKRAGVSKSTVSRVLTSDSRVRSTTRARVEAVVREMGYRPNALARGLISGRMQTIGLIVFSLHNPFFGLLAHEVERVARARGYNVLIATSNESVAQQQESLELFAEQRVSGVLVTPINGDERELAAIEDMRLPTVLLNSIAGNDALSSVGVDGVRGGYLAAHHLLALGHHRIGFIGPRTGYPERSRGFRQAHKERDVAVDESLLRGNLPDDNAIQAVVSDFLAMSQPPTAICTVNDEMAITVLQALAHCGVRVPQDVSLIGYDDLPVAARLDPPLTTVAQPLDQQSRLATDLLIKLVTDPRTPVQRIVLQPRLIIRESCGVAQAHDRLADRDAALEVCVSQIS